MSLDTLNSELALTSTTPRMYRKQYAVVPPGETKIAGYARSTTVAKTLDNTSNLDKWGKRIVTIGLTRRADLLSTAALHTSESKEDKAALDAICEQAHIAGGGTVRRDQGTAIHKMMELDHTDPNYVVPEIHRAEVEAINAALAANDLQVVPEFSEMLCVLDAHRIAGRPDIVVRHTATGTLYIADLKTGASVDYSQLAWSVQFAIAANADNRYVQGAAKDGSEDGRLPMPPLSRETAIILHQQPGGIECVVYDLDIAQGREALEVAMEVRRLRALGKSKRTPLLVPRNFEGGGGAQVTADVDATPAPVTPVEAMTAKANARWEEAGRPVEALSAELLHQTRVAWVRNRITELKDAGHIRTVTTNWPEGVAKPPAIAKGDTTWSANDLDLIVVHLDRCEARWEMPFGTPDPAAAAARATTMATPLVPDVPQLAQPDEGDWANDDEVRSLRHILTAYLKDKEYEPKARQVLEWSKDGHIQSRPFNMGDPDQGQQTSQRRYLICLAALDCALELFDPGADDPEFGVRAALALAIGEDPQLVWRTGGILGSLTTEQARRLGDIACTHRVAIGDDGTPQLLAAA